VNGNANRRCVGRLEAALVRAHPADLEARMEDLADRQGDRA